MSATAVPYKLEKYIKEGQNKVVMNLWVHKLSKMLWKFKKIQQITALTSTTSFYVNSQSRDSGQLAQ